MCPDYITLIVGNTACSGQYEECGIGGGGLKDHPLHMLFGNFKLKYRFRLLINVIPARSMLHGFCDLAM